MKGLNSRCVLAWYIGSFVHLITQFKGSGACQATRPLVLMIKNRVKLEFLAIFARSPYCVTMKNGLQVNQRYFQAYVNNDPWGLYIQAYLTLNRAHIGQNLGVPLFSWKVPTRFTWNLSSLELPLELCKRWPPSTMWAGAGSINLFMATIPRGCLKNNPIFSNLGLCAACWAHFMCHHELWPTSVGHPFSFLNSSWGLTGGKHHQKITIAIFRFVLKNFTIPSYFPYIYFSITIFSPYFLLCFSQETS